MTRDRRTYIVGVLLASGIAGGCASKLDTGYKPTPLSDGLNARRAYYAEPYSPEAAAAGKDATEAFDTRRPGQTPGG